MQTFLLGHSAFSLRVNDDEGEVSDSEHARKHLQVPCCTVGGGGARQTKLTPARRDAGDFVMDRIIPEAEFLVVVFFG